MSDPRDERASDGSQAERPESDTANARDTFRRIHEALRQRVVGHEDALARIALFGASQELSGAGARAVLVGPSGAGKTHMCATLAATLGRPYAHVDCTALTAEGWDGLQPSMLIAGMAKSYPLLDPSQLERAVIVLDEFDKLAWRKMRGPSRDHRRDIQLSLLALVGGGMEVRYGVVDRDRNLSWRSDRALVIAAGVFSGLPDFAVPADLIRLGFIPEVVERLGTVIRLQALPATQLVGMLRRGMELTSLQYVSYGYHLEVSPAALHVVAAKVAAGVGAAGPRSGIAWLQAAAHVGLIGLLESDAPTGARHVLAPDDLCIPSDQEPPRRRGRGA